MGDMPEEPKSGERPGWFKGEKSDLLLNLCLIHQHDRDTVFDGVDTLAFYTLEPQLTWSQLEGLLAQRAN
jgi:hypothetical protein